MSCRRLKPLSAVIALTVSAVAIASGCAEASLDVGARIGDEDSSAPPSFTPQDSGTDADARAPETLALCIATTCPAPFAQCGSGYACGTNLSNDSKNCGACGKECPESFGYLNLSSACVSGTCEPLCAKKPIYGGFESFADCNKVLEDGCEISISTDAKNCGACGNQCAAGVRCIDGKCGCDAGKVDCDGLCIDVRNDDGNCGACGNACAYPQDAGQPPPHMELGCVDKQCGQLRCIDGYGDTWADCDKNLANGCEVFIGLSSTDTDPNNCGKCGNKCTGDQVCWDITGDFLPECNCTKPQETQCGTIDTSDLGCYDLQSDPDNCGTCFHRCSAYLAHTAATCQKGSCEFACEPGWGDCDGNKDNGCETNIKVSDGNCGSCGNCCDTQAGQPCIEGRCAMTECDAGAGPK